ncbi:NACHT domain-containing protein [Streptomyces sp. WMMB 322]|nr:NACHT domain-containing protein [Streptomyces sp. WMMB 322]
MPLVKKLFVKEGPGAGLAGKPVRISSLVSFRGEKRVLSEKDLRKLVRELVQRAAQEAGIDDESEAVIDALVRTLHALGDLDMDDVQALSLGEQALRRELYEAAGGKRLTSTLSGPSVALYEYLLDSACLHILHFFTQRSTFVARTLVEQSKNLRELAIRTDLLLERLASRTAGDAAFEKRYAEYVARKHSRITIYGIDLNHSREWPLDTAYLNLEVTQRSDEADWADTHSGSSWTPAVHHRVDEALARHKRVLLRGVAGSGKTTLMQWLAVSTADQRRLTGDLVHLSGMVPFVLPLRTLARGGEPLPDPERFLGAVGCPLAGAQPHGWATRVLSAGRGLILVDGIDEVTEDDRERTRRWLCDLLVAFPGSRLLVTSRPSAVREEWLGSEDFAELSLSGMRPADVAVFVRRWHDAADAGGELEESLLGELRVKHDLARLATNPLMCGLICALHRERRGFLPRGRKALYDAALSMMLERRDRERHLGPLGGIELDAESQTELLQKLAYWLIRNGRAEMDSSDAVELLARVLPSMPYAREQGSPQEILRFLLVRSGLLREPVEGAVDFVHRTFQDYLAARELVEERDFDLLVRHAHEDQWDDVVRMAVAHARPDERARILRMLVKRGDEEADARIRLYLLATACLEHATKMDPAVRNEVELRAAAMFPPRSFEEAKELAAVGPVALELLPGPELLEDDEAEAVAHAVAQIGSDAALARLTEFLNDARPDVLRQLAGHWDRFDTEVYGREIIAPLVGRTDVDVAVTVRSRKELDVLSRLDRPRKVYLHGDFTAEEITEALPTGELTELRLSRNNAVSDLQFLRRFRLLEDLELYETNVTDVSPLADLQLHTLTLRLHSPAGLHRLAGLKRLVMSGRPSTISIAELPTSLDTLVLFSMVCDLTGTGGLTNLTDLRLNETHLAERDWAEVAQLPRLRALTLDVDGLDRLARSGKTMPQVSEVQLLCDGSAARLRSLAGVFPAVNQVSLAQPGEGTDLSPLTALPGLARLSLFRPPPDIDAERLDPSVEVIVRPRPRP